MDRLSNCSCGDSGGLLAEDKRNGWGPGVGMVRLITGQAPSGCQIQPRGLGIPKGKFERLTVDVYTPT